MPSQLYQENIQADINGSIGSGVRPKLQIAQTCATNRHSHKFGPNGSNKRIAHEWRSDICGGKSGPGPRRGATTRLEVGGPRARLYMSVDKVEAIRGEARAKAISTSVVTRSRCNGDFEMTNARVTTGGEAAGAQV